MFGLGYLLGGRRSSMRGRGTRVRQVGRRTRSQRSRTRYEAVASVTGLRVYDRRHKLSLRGLWPSKRHNRRSRSRLAAYRTEAQIRQTRVASSTSVRISGSQAFHILLLGVLGWLLVWFFVSNRFYVNQVVVEGNQRVSSEAVVTASGVYGYSIFWVNPGRVAEAITESLPPVRAVRVRYGLPNVVRLTVEEQGKHIVWLIGDQRYWVDDGGFLHPAQGGDDPYLTVRDTRPGVREQVDIDAVVAAHQLTQLLPELKAVEYAPSTGLRFTHARGWTVYLGKGTEMVPRIQALRAIERRFADESAAQPSVVDVRFPENPYYR